MSEKFEQTIRQLEQTYRCPVLIGHFKSLFKGVFDQISVNDFKNPTALIPFLFERDYAFYSDNYRKHLLSKFAIPEVKRDELIAALENDGRIYVLFSIMPFASSAINEEIEQLKKIAAQAAKLKSLLPDEDDPLFMLLKLINLAETRDYHSNETAVFFSQMKHAITSLETLPSLIPQSKAGQLYKIGIKSPKGNIGLKVWIHALFKLWVQGLERSFDYDGLNGISGRKRFTDFVHESLLPIHQNIEYETVKNAIRHFDENIKTGDGLLSIQNHP